MRSNLACVPAVPFAVGVAWASTPWAVEVRSYDPGSTAAPGYTDPAAALGEPSRFTGKRSGFPGVVSMFNPAFESDQIVSIGEGGHLTLRLDRPALDSPGNRFGVDLVVFGNAGFIDVGFPAGQIGAGAPMFGLGQARLELSADGVSFVAWGVFTEGLFPTVGYLDADPFQGSPGLVASDFLRPMDPGLTRGAFAGLTHAQALALYDGSGGGTPIDQARAGLSAARYVRIGVEDDGDPGTSLKVEIDAVAVVPAPAGGLAMVMLAAVGARRRR
ncbi:MAG: hypothetical protein FJ255_04815 [Phycisphaerae bacterium]|nr:hypothetical protein [Phycisphaerae bacterium]